MKIIDRLRVINMYVAAFAILFVLQKLTLGFIPGIQHVMVFGGFYFSEVLFALVAVVFIALFVRAELPKSHK
ncbi:hypothetical protein CEB3_c18510 [Peptococcaceae bacterium CEB3]|nr:hypothetical protein CEB3_c18510 [Peptococcaceae bacterium CEB3]